MKNALTIHPRWCTTHFIMGMAFLALILKLQIARTTIGTNDVTTWQHFTTQIQTIGLVQLYREEPLFNHPPLVGLMLPLIGWLGVHTFLAFPFWLRLPAILADLATVIIILRLVGPGIPVLLLAACPPLIMISGFHGNTDPVMIMWTLLAVWVLAHAPVTARRATAAAAVLALAISTKIVPVILLPAFILWLPSWRTRAAFCLALSVVVLAIALPVLRLAPVALVRNVLAYPSVSGQWGMGRLFWLTRDAPRPLWLKQADQAFEQYGRLLDGLAIVVLAAWMNLRRWPKPALFVQCGLTMLVFLALSPGFRVQYLAWVMPWLVAVQLPWLLLVYATSSTFLAAVYSFWAGQWPWYYAASPPSGWSTRGSLIVLELLAWLVIATTAVRLGTTVRSSRLAISKPSARVIRRWSRRSRSTTTYSSAHFLRRRQR